VRWGWLFSGDNRQGAPVIVAIVVSILVWIVSFLLIRALSRYREYSADRGAALITGKPGALASALMTIDGRMDRVPKEDLREEAEMNAFFIIPIKAGFVGKIASTHPRRRAGSSGSATSNGRWRRPEPEPSRRPPAGQTAPPESLLRAEGETRRSIARIDPRLVFDSVERSRSTRSAPEPDRSRTEYRW